MTFNGSPKFETLDHILMPICRKYLSLSTRQVGVGVDREDGETKPYDPSLRTCLALSTFFTLFIHAYFRDLLQRGHNQSAENTLYYTVF